MRVKKSKEKKTKKQTSEKKLTKSKAKATKQSKSKTKKTKNSDIAGNDVGIVVIEDDLKIDKEAENEERRAYLEEARSQEAFD